MSISKRCVLCGKEEKAEKQSHFEEVFKCEEYKTIYKIQENLLKDYRIRSSLRYFITHNKTSKNLFWITKQPRVDDDYNIITVDELLNLFPNTISDRLDKILLNLANLSNGIGSTVEIFGSEEEVAKFSAVFFLQADVEYEERINSIIKMLRDMGYIQTIIESPYIELKIDYRGWERIDKLQAGNKSYSKGFIAMWFNKDMIEYRKAIIEAIYETGYIHSIIDDKEYNGQIVPEIFYEMKTSDFVIADLTGNRGGVYYEAGYALGLGKELIITIKDISDKDDDISSRDKEKYIPHFDVAQRNQIRYKDAEDLKTKLIKRIKATVGENSNKKNI